MEFSEKLKELRGEKGISQAKLAADIHISRSAVAKWENGLGLPNDESLKLLADYFGITIDELIPNKSNEEILVSKNKTIDQQKKVIIGFAAGCAIGLFILGFIFIEPLRESLVQLGFGAFLKKWTKEREYGIIIDTQARRKKDVNNQIRRRL